MSDIPASGDAPPELVAAGAPAKFEDWSEEMRKQYLTGEGSQPTVTVSGDPADQVEVVAIAETGDSGEAMA